MDPRTSCDHSWHKLLRGRVSLTCCFTMQILHSSRDFPGEINGDHDLGSNLHRADVHHSKCSVAAATSGTTHELQYDLQTETFVVIYL